MSQSRSMSLVETCASTAIGYTVALATQAVVFPLFEIRTSKTEDAAIALIFTLVSLVRGYLVRRMFVHIHCIRFFAKGCK